MASQNIWFCVLLTVQLVAGEDKTEIYEDDKVLLDSYIPAAMQLLAYHMELLRYETLASTTIEPPFYGDDHEDNNGTTTTTKTDISNIFLSTTQKPFRQETTTKQRVSTTTHKPWYVHTTTKKVIWWSPPSTTPRPPRTTTKKIVWWPLSTTSVPHRTTTKKFTWWPVPTTPQPDITTTKKPQRTTKKPQEIWWFDVATTSMAPYTTKRHSPAVFAPKDPVKKRRFRSFFNEPGFSEWFHKPKAVKLKSDLDFNLAILDPLPASLAKEVNNELSQLPAIRDDDNVRVFLNKYDDSYRYRNLFNSAGKKRVPPAKPYVEFLILYDLIKRDAKAAKLEEYQGYTKKMEKELDELSSRSSEIQLYYVLKRMLAGHNKILRNDVVKRVTDIINDLQNPKSATSKILRYIPPLNFVL